MIARSVAEPTINPAAWVLPPGQNAAFGCKSNCCIFFSFSPRKDLIGAPHLFFTPSPSGNKSKGRRAKPGVLKFFSLLSRAGMQGPSSHFFSFLARGTKAADERSLGAVAPLLLLLLPPQGCKAPHLFFTLPPSGNKSQGSPAKAGCCRFFSLSRFSFLPPPPLPRRIQGPSSLF